jgi:hypothetical protein
MVLSTQSSSIIEGLISAFCEKGNYRLALVLAISDREGSGLFRIEAMPLTSIAVPRVARSLLTLGSAMNSDGFTGSSIRKAGWTNFTVFTVFGGITEIEKTLSSGHGDIQETAFFRDVVCSEVRYGALVNTRNKYNWPFQACDVSQKKMRRVYLWRHGLLR